MRHFRDIENALKTTVLAVLFEAIYTPSVQAEAHELLRYGTPHIIHFSKRDYRAGNKNWSVAQDDLGFIYAGNSNGLLQYDGIRWKRFDLPGSPIIRSVLADGDRIYTGGLGEFGYWEKDAHFDLHYTSLTHLTGSQLNEDEEVWWIRKFGDDIYFQSFGKTFVYDGQSVELLIYNAGVLFPPFSVNQNLYIQGLTRGIFEVLNKKVVFVPGSEIFIGKPVNMMVPLGTGQVLIGTERDGFYIYTAGRFKRWEVSSNRDFRLYQINRGLKICDTLYAVGTILNGLYIMDHHGDVINHINKDRGLQNNTVLSLMLDREHNVWAGLDNGIDLIKINSPLYFETDVSGKTGSVYSCALHDSRLYLGTNRGVFFKPSQPARGKSLNDQFTLLRGTQGQVWDLSVIDNTLFCGHNKSTFVIEDSRVEKAADVAGGYDMKRYPYDNRYLVQGSYNGLAIYKKRNDRWDYLHHIKGFGKLTRKFEFERENIVWVSHPYRGLYRLELSDDLKTVVDQRSFSQNSKSYVNKLNNKIIFSSDSGFVYYDDIRHRFYLLEKLNQALGHFSENARLIRSHDDVYWIFKDGECAVAVMDDSEVRALDQKIADGLVNKLIPGYEGIYRLDSLHTLIFLDDGYAIYNDAWKQKKKSYHPQLYLRKCSFKNRNDQEYLTPGDSMTVPFRYNHVSFQFSYPNFNRHSDLEYMLEDYDTRWTAANFQNEITYRNLPHGNYVLKARPVQQPEAQSLLVQFSILPPWYESNMAKILYAVAIILLALLGMAIYRRNIESIHRRHEFERKQLLEKKAAENEKKMVEIRNENLRKEIKLRNSRLARSTFSLIHKNNTLTAVKEELTRIKEELGARFPTKHFNRIVKNIDKDMTSENDWAMFEQSFSEVHENFLQKLKEQYPDLTPADIQLCAYLKMNLSSKEIASLLNITTRGVEIRRYRLRKKLQLEHDTNLVEFIMGY